MRKTSTFKSLLLTALLCAGATGAWADNVYTILYGVPDYDTDGVITAVTPQTDFYSEDGNTASEITSSDANGVNCTNAMPIDGSVLYSSASFTKKFDSPATKGIVHFEANYTTTTNGQETWKIIDSTGKEIWGSTDAGYSNGSATKNIGFCDGESLGTGYYRQARKAHNRVVLDINLVKREVEYTILVSSGNNSYTTLTGTYNLPEGVSDVAGLSATKQSYYSYMDNVSFYNVYDDDVAEYVYILNYQLNGETVATKDGAAEAGAVVSAATSLWNDGNTQKYYVEDGEVTSFIVSEGTNTFNVAVREAEQWTYNINAVVGGEDLLTISTNTVVEGESTSYGYPKYVAKDGTLYVTTAQSSNPWWGKSFTPAADGATQSITYTAEGTEGIVFCSEAENIEGASVVSGGNTDIRASNRMGAYGVNVKVTTLAPGKYKILSALYGNRGTTITFNVGNTTVFSLTTSGNPVHTVSDEFEVTATSDLTFNGGNAGNSPKIVDYIIIQKTGDVELPTKVAVSFGSNGYTTFASKYALDFTDIGDVTAYTAQVGDGVVTFTKVSGKVPANTGLLLEGTAETTIPTTTAATEAISGNDFLVNTTGATFAADAAYTYYAMVKDSSPLKFGTVDPSAVAIPADKAYLKVAASTARLSAVFADATGIAGARLGAAAADGCFNLQGQRVSQPSKGLYISGGKKVVVK